MAQELKRVYCMRGSMRIVSRRVSLIMTSLQLCVLRSARQLICLLVSLMRETIKS